MFIHGKLVNSFLYFVCAKLKFKLLSLNVTSAIMELPIYIPGFLKTGLAKITTHFTTWQLKTITFVQRPIKSFYLTPGGRLMIPRSIPTSRSLK